MLGCGQHGAKQRQLPTFAAHGVIKFNSEPIPDAMLAFHPVNAFPGDKADCIPRATVKNDGRFTIETYSSDDGAPVGDYRVTVTWQGPLKGYTEDQRALLLELL